MPSQYDLPRAQDQWREQELERYAKLPYHLASMTAKRFPIWHQWDKLFGTRPWTPNQGTELRAIEATYSPVARQVFFPNPATQMPNRDVHETSERKDSAVLYRHQYETPYFNWRGPFEDFRRMQIPHNVDDLTRQIALANDMFIRTFVFHYAAHVMISGKENTNNGDSFDGGDFVAAPSGIGASDGSSAKTTAWLQQAVSYLGEGNANLSYKTVKRAITIFREDVCAPCFEGMYNMPKDNELIKGKVVLMTSTEALEYLEFDPHVLSFQRNNVTIEDSEFKGRIGSNCVIKTERFPLRMLADGTFPEPETIQGSQDAYNYGETIPNPEYTSAEYEWAFLLGGSAFESIKVGPPPAEFANQRMATAKFNKLQWNGEVRLTDNFLLNIGTEEAPKLTTNKYGEFVQLIADTMHGILPVNRRYVLPILFRRKRVEVDD